MRVLMVTYAMDSESPVLWWQDRVARAVASRCERLLVLTEALGVSAQPANVQVRVVPRWRQRLPARPLGAKGLMARGVARWCEAEGVTVCFVHMAAEWAPRLAPWLRRLGIPIVLWYAHGTAGPTVRRAHDAATRVITSSREGFPLPSAKVRVIGQGIDVERFGLRDRPLAPRDVVVVGRLSARKRINLAIQAFAEAARRRADLRLRLVGPVLNRADRRYVESLHGLVRQLHLEHRVSFEGPRSPATLASVFQTALVHLSVSLTGSLDKAVLEALSTGCPVLASGEPFRELLAEVPSLWLENDAPAAIGQRIEQLHQNWRRYDPMALRSLVVGRHDLDRHVEALVRELEGAVAETQPGR